MQRAGVDLRTRKAFERKLKLLNQIGEDWGLVRIASLNDSELQGLLGPGGNSIQQIRDKALRIVKPPTQTVKTSLDDILATAVGLLLRSGIAPKMINRKSYRRRLAQLVRIGAIYGLKYKQLTQISKNNSALADLPSANEILALSTSFFQIHPNPP